MEQFSLIAWFVDVFDLPSSWAGPYLHIVMSILATMIILAMSLLAWLRLKATNRRLMPDDHATLANIFEVLIERIVKMMEDTMGPAARNHLPLIGSLFIYILVCNFLGVIPGLTPPTENVNTNLACAIVVFIYYNYVGIKERGLRRYLKHMGGPIIWLAPLIFAIELISHLVRPLSLSVRLFGNISGDHMVLGIFSNLLPFLVPIIFQILAIFVAFIQAFVFTLLSVVYIALATESEGH